MQPLGFTTINPSTGEEIEAFSFYNSAEIEGVLARAEKSFESFRKLPVHQRAELLSDLAEALRKNKSQLAKVITTEMGKILPEAEAEVEKCAWEADWYAEHGPQMLADAPAPTGGVNAYVSYLPLGPILAIMPWNFPIWQLTRMALPTMLAGNVVLVKHSHNTQRSSLEFEQVIREAPFLCRLFLGSEAKTVFRKDNSFRPSGSRRSRSGRKCKQAWQAGRDRGGQYE